MSSTPLAGSDGAAISCSAGGGSVQSLTATCQGCHRHSEQSSPPCTLPAAAGRCWWQLQGLAHVYPPTGAVPTPVGRPRDRARGSVGLRQVAEPGGEGARQHGLGGKISNWAQGKRLGIVVRDDLQSVFTLC